MSLQQYLANSDNRLDKGYIAEVLGGDIITADAVFGTVLMTTDMVQQVSEILFGEDDLAGISGSELAIADIKVGMTFQTVLDSEVVVPSLGTALKDLGAQSDSSSPTTEEIAEPVETQVGTDPSDEAGIVLAFSVAVFRTRSKGNLLSGAFSGVDQTGQQKFLFNYSTKQKFGWGVLGGASIDGQVHTLPKDQPTVKIGGIEYVNRVDVEFNLSDRHAAIVSAEIDRNKAALTAGADQNGKPLTKGYQLQVVLKKGQNFVLTQKKETVGSTNYLKDICSIYEGMVHSVRIVKLGQEGYVYTSASMQITQEAFVDQFLEPLQGVHKLASTKEEAKELWNSMTSATLGSDQFTTAKQTRTRGESRKVNKAAFFTKKGDKLETNKAANSDTEETEVAS
jgi:hypothetical protein